MANSRPKVILSAAISIDGKIATSSGDSKLSSKQDSVRLHKIRSSVDAILIGKNTVSKDNPLLTVRHVKGKNPVRIILDSNGTISSSSKIIQTSNKIPTIIATSQKITAANYKRLQKLPIELIETGTNTVNLKSLLRILGTKNIKTILVEGGGTTNWEFIKNNLFDEMVVTVSPYVIGGKDSISLVEGQGFKKIANSPNLKLKSTKRLKNHLVLTYVKL